MLLITHWPIIIGCFVLAVVSLFWKILRKSKVPRAALPPFVPLTEHELQHTPLESITRAFEQHGPVIQIHRNGHRLFLTSNEFTQQILTDESYFSFESGMTKFFGLSWVNKLHDGTFFHDMDTYARGFVAQRMQKVVPEIWPIFEKGVREMVDTSQPGRPVELQHQVQAIMAEATICIFFGQKYGNARNVKSVVDLAEDIAELLGIYQNLSFLGRKASWLWKPLTWIKIVLFRIPLHIGFTFTRTLWTDISEISKSPEKKVSATIMIWVTFHLGMRPGCQDDLRDEVSSILKSWDKNHTDPVVDIQAMLDAVRTDSFIREVLRMKGDIVNLVRAPVRDIELGGYIIPKGSLVFPVTHLSYRSPEFVTDPEEFKGERWIGSGKTAGMTGSGYLAFGLGRWACPGRVLAVMELKCWIFALLKHAKVELDGCKYEILDPFNITSVPPQGDILVEKYTASV
ncbi:uncharacterized protein N7477_007469 [Penicillium maclennaniae]|uniref:uncharacterized protein n=1 Tax=Penicillium maclennaniae TaxID=1343394 RepID=UPI0025411CE9|nr:uncharacterized protein N7477_007469 [Penicillium maclennaniae]KAJ5665021.1 hypothetical protein N7477_007469 [Penicillium maclennaniae]